MPSAAIMIVASNFQATVSQVDFFIIIFGGKRHFIYREKVNYKFGIWETTRDLKKALSIQMVKQSLENVYLS